MRSLAILLCTAGLGVLLPGCDPGMRSVPIVAQYTGQASVPLPEREGTVAAPECLLIRDAGEYEAFLARIPVGQVGKTAPAPPSTDPLLPRPAIDFGRQALLVALRADTMDVAPRITDVVALPWRRELSARVSFPPLGEAASLQQAQGIGAYTAVLVEPGFAVQGMNWRLVLPVPVRDGREGWPAPGPATP